MSVFFTASRHRSANSAHSNEMPMGYLSAVAKESRGRRLDRPLFKRRRCRRGQADLMRRAVDRAAGLANVTMPTGGAAPFLHGTPLAQTIAFMHQYQA